MLMYRTIKFVDRVTDYILLLAFLLLFLIGFYTVYDTLKVYEGALGNDLKSFRPMVTDTGEVVWDMSALSEDMVAWLTVDDTNIDYPVMQGEDNNEYLNKNPYGKYALSGSLFLDYQNSPDFTDPYSLIYGHHMEYGHMFGALDKFGEETYFDAHTTGTLTVADKIYELKIFAYVEADAAQPEIFSPKGGYDTLEYVRENALIWREPEGERLLAMSTCKFPMTTDRIIVFGVLKDVNPSVAHGELPSIEELGRTDHSVWSVEE